MRKKSLTILKAVAAGRSCEQILAANPGLNYHDIFHAIAEAPTSHWKRNPATQKTWPRSGNQIRKGAIHRVD
jgi:uncharacterized protein (DUF433 family)